MKQVVITIEDDEEIKWVGGILTKIKKNNEPKSIMDRVKSYEDACRVLEISDFLNDPDTTVIMKENKYKMPQKLISLSKLEIIIEALNEGWIAEEHDSKKWYYPWFSKLKDGKGLKFKFGSCNGSEIYPGYGSSLALKSEKLAEYCGKQFIDLWTNYLLG